MSGQPIFAFAEPWVPEDMLRGNARLHHMQKYRLTSKLRQDGADFGVIYKNQHPEISYPVADALRLHLDVWGKRHIDWENIAIGYKSFIDGLEVPNKQGVPGACLIVNDRHIKEVRIGLHTGKTYTTLLLEVL